MADLDRPVWTPENAPEPLLQSAQAGAVYLRLDDNVRITSFNSAAGVTLACRSRMVDLRGLVQVGNDLQTPNTDRTAKATIVASDEGWLLGGAVFVTAGTPLEGQCFVVVEIVRGQGAAALALEHIAAGYVTAKQPLRFPSLSSLRSLDGHGALRVITGATPGAGAEISETVPTGARWELLAFAALFTTGVAVAARVPALVLDDGATAYQQVQAPTSIPASTVELFGWSQAGVNTAAGVLSAQNASIGVGIRLLAAHRIRTVTGLIQAADQYSAIRYLVREWLEGA